MARTHKNGSSKYEHFTKLCRPMMQTDAWRALSPKAQALYPWLRLEWKGANNNNNGKIRLSYRQAARCMGITPNTAGEAFHELQAKGFIVVTQLGALGVEGQARGHSYELTELSIRNERPRCLYKKWNPDAEFEVVRVKPNNPNGYRKKQNPVENI